MWHCTVAISRLYQKKDSLTFLGRAGIKVLCDSMGLKLLNLFILLQAQNIHTKAMP